MEFFVAGRSLVFFGLAAFARLGLAFRAVFWAGLGVSVFMAVIGAISKPKQFRQVFVREDFCRV